MGIKIGMTEEQIDAILRDMVNNATNAALETAAKVVERETARLGLNDGGSISMKIRKMKMAQI